MQDFIDAISAGVSLFFLGHNWKHFAPSPEEKLQIAFLPVTLLFAHFLAHHPSAHHPNHKVFNPPTSIAAICQWMDTSNWQFLYHFDGLGAELCDRNPFFHRTCHVPCSLSFILRPSLFVYLWVFIRRSERQSSAKPFLTCPDISNGVMGANADQPEPQGCPGARTRTQRTTNQSGQWLAAWLCPHNDNSITEMEIAAGIKIK